VEALKEFSLGIATVSKVKQAQEKATQMKKKLQDNLLGNYTQKL